MHKTLLPLNGAASLFLLLLLTGCASKPIVRYEPVTVKVPVYIALPVETLQVAVKPVLRGQNPTNEDLAGLAEHRGAVIDQLNSQLDAIRKLQPPAR